MYLLYIIALLPVIGGLFAWIFCKRIALVEWTGAAAVGFLLAGLIHLIALHNMTADVETWSGHIIQAREFSAWKEYYEYAVYRTEYYEEEESYTDSEGRSRTRTVTHSRQVFDHWEPTTRWHDINWACYSNINTSYNINQKSYNWYVDMFKDKHAVPGDRETMEHNSHMIEGDPNDYVADNKTGFISPITKSVYFENRIKAAPSTFSFIQVSKNIPVYDYPANSDPFRSDRLLGEANKAVSLMAFDQMNARLGPKKRVNVILIGFGDMDSSIAEYQKAKYIGGKKNDLILCYGNNWARVYGWTENELVKRNLETILLDNQINDAILSLIEKEIEANYVLKDWKKFDYISIEPPKWAIPVLLIVMFMTQAILWVWFSNNDVDKYNDIIEYD